VWTLRRAAARVVLLDDSDRVLLLEASDPASPAKGTWWELPGGGIEGGEPSSVAAARELHEETGIHDVEMGPCVWRHHAKFTFGGYNFDQHEHIHMARHTQRDQASDDAAAVYRPARLEALEALSFKGVRWWELGELAELVASGGRVIPPWLPEQLPTVLASGIPADPIDMGELGNAI
jgi:8-oxo-dGTP pyrophosphatase MutT (NUDIX family)